MDSKGENHGKILLGFFLGTFALASIFWLAWELQTSQGKVDFLGSLIGRELGPAIKGGGAGPGRLAEALDRHRDRLELERIVLFGNQGAKLAESAAATLKTAGAEIHGMLASGRAGVRDPATGREIGHLVVWRRVETGRSFLGGIIAALVITYIASRWLKHASRLRGKA